VIRTVEEREVNGRLGQRLGHRDATKPAADHDYTLAELGRLHLFNLVLKPAAAMARSPHNRGYFALR
jgi:hypothetical protein